MVLKIVRRGKDDDSKFTVPDSDYDLISPRPLCEGEPYLSRAVTAKRPSPVIPCSTARSPATLGPESPHSYVVGSMRTGTDATARSLTAAVGNNKQLAQNAFFSVTRLALHRQDCQNLQYMSYSNIFSVISVQDQVFICDIQTGRQ
jgi:hypothetical protein